MAKKSLFELAEDAHRAIAAGDWAYFGKKPKSSCKKCYGRGYQGVNDLGKYVVCPCVRSTRKED